MSMSQRLSRRELMTRLSAAAVLAAAGCGRKSAGAANEVSIATGAGGLNTTMSELLRQQKFLESFDLKPTVLAMADGSKILSGIYSGSVDVSPMSGFGQVFPAIEHGADLKLISAATLLPAQAMFSAKPTVTTLKDLEGKNVGVGAVGALVHQLTVSLLRKYSVDISKVRFVTIGSNTDIFKGVMAGTVDAGTGPASFVGDAESYGVHAIEHGNMSAELKEFTYQAGWTSARVIKDKRDVVVRVLAAYAKLFRFVQDPAAKEAFLSARKAVFPNAPAKEHLAEWNYLQTYQPFASDLTLSPERIDYMQKINIEFQIQKEMLPYERVADMSLAEDARKLLG